LLRCRVTPNANKSEIPGWTEDHRPGTEGLQRALRVKLKAPPVDGKANRELVVFLAGQLGLSKSAVSLCSGEKSRLKSVRIEGLSESELAVAIEKLLAKP